MPALNLISSLPIAWRQSETWGKGEGVQLSTNFTKTSHDGANSVSLHPVHIMFFLFSQHNSTAGVTGETSTAGEEEKSASREQHLGLN